MKRHILIVGGTRGIGRVTAQVLARQGYIVSVIGRRRCSKMRSLPVTFWQVDLLDKVRLLRALREIVLRNGKLSALIFFQRYRGNGDDWQGEIATSLTVSKDIIEYLVDKFEGRGERSILFISSLASHYIAKEQPLSYHIAKAAFNQMARYYAVRFGSVNIRVNSLLFGAILKEEAKKFYLKNKRLLKLYKDTIPLGRMGTSQDVANAIVFLCSPNAAFITGQCIIIDGGVSIQSHETLARQLTSLKTLNVVRNSR